MTAFCTVYPILEILLKLLCSAHNRDSKRVRVNNNVQNDDFRHLVKGQEHVWESVEKCSEYI